MSMCGVTSGGVYKGLWGVGPQSPFWKMEQIATPVLKLQRLNANHHLLKLIPCPSLSYIMSHSQLRIVFFLFQVGKLSQ